MNGVLCNKEQTPRENKGWTGISKRWFCHVEWKPQDCWVGVFWKRKCPLSLDVWVCLLPMLPIHFGYIASVEHG